MFYIRILTGEARNIKILKIGDGYVIAAKYVPGIENLYPTPSVHVDSDSELVKWCAEFRPHDHKLSIFWLQNIKSKLFYNQPIFFTFCSYQQFNHIVCGVKFNIFGILFKIEVYFQFMVKGPKLNLIVYNGPVKIYTFLNTLAISNPCHSYLKHKIKQSM